MTAGTAAVAEGTTGAAKPRIVVAPRPEPFAVDAVLTGGGELVGDGEGAQGLVWLRWRPDGLAEALGRNPTVRWVQLPMAGVERVLETRILAEPAFAGVTWTCAKGSYARPVAEHALALALAGLRGLPERARARSWGKQAGTTLHGAPVTILGGGGICVELLALLEPFGVQATVVRRQAQPLAGTARTLPAEALHDAIPGALVVFVALALSPETIRVIGPSELALMGAGSWLVNVARGRHVDTDALVAALTERRIGGAALDVTDPEPLPDGHPLWSLPNCLITPHTADTPEMVRPLMAERIRQNIGRLAAGLPLIGVIDPLAGY